MKEKKQKKIESRKKDHIQLINLNYSTFVNVVCSYCYKQKKNFFSKTKYHLNIFIRYY